MSDFIIVPNMEFREQTAQISEICSLVASKGNGGLCKFTRLIPPQTEAKISNIENVFTPVPNRFEIYNKMDQIIVAISKNYGTKGTFGGAESISLA